MTQEQRVSANEVGLLVESEAQATKEAKREAWNRLDKAISTSYDIEALLRVAAVAADDEGFGKLGGDAVLRMVADMAGSLTSNLEHLHNCLFRKQEATE